MISRDEAFDLIARVLACCDQANGAEVALLGGELSLTRFANSVIHQNVAEQRVLVSVRTVLGKRTARATTSRLDHEGIEAVAKQALEATQGAREDPELVPLLESSEPPDPAPPNLSEAEEDADAQRAEMFAQARETVGRDGTLFGYASAKTGCIGDYDDASAFAVGNSKGLRRFAVPRDHALSLTVRVDDSTAWAHAESPVDQPIDAEALAQRALEKAQRLADGLRTLDPGEMTVILEAPAAAALLKFLAEHVNARAVLEERSFLTGKLGQKVFGNNVYVFDDHIDPLHRGVPFDAEGMTRESMPLIEAGVVSNFVSDRATAKKMGIQPSGHSLPLPSSEGAHAAHLVMLGDETSLEEMIRSTQRGVFVTRSWYSNFVDFKRATITGMTRDGTFLIENGEIAAGLHDLRYNISLFELLGNIEAQGALAKFEGTVAPALKVRGFRFSS